MPGRPGGAAVVAATNGSSAPLPSGPWKADRMLGIIGLSMWLGTTIRVWPLLPLIDNFQCCLGMLCMFLISVAWPTFGLRSYLRHRIPAIAFLRVALFALPFNFSTQVFDAIAPAPGTGRLAVVSNLFQVFLACRIALLTFTSLGWRLPHRLHMVLQALNIAMLIRFGMHNYCRSKLLSSPELEATIAVVHSTMAFVAMVFVPSAGILVPDSPYAQRIAFLLICWVLLGWLVPTLLLLPEREPPGSRSPASSSAGAGAAATRLASRFGNLLEAWLHILKPAAPRMPQAWGARQEAQGGAQISASATFLLHWWAVIMVCWAAACSAAPLFLAGKGIA